MEEEINTVRHDKMKAFHALTAVSEGLPALGIVAAVLGVIKAMGAISESPEVLGHLIGSALVGTFAGIFSPTPSSRRSPPRSRASAKRRCGCTCWSSRRCSPS